MKTLYIVRHAKSSWDNDHLSDHERPLNKRGIHDAPVMGKRLVQHQEQPDYILSSSATRAQLTSQYIATELGYPHEKINVDDALYGATPDTLIQAVKNLSDTVTCAMLIGHNPTITEFLNLYAQSYISNAPTCSIAKLQIDAESWKHFSQESTKLIDFDYPKKGETSDLGL